MVENIRLAFQGIWSHKLRSILTMLGIIIGIAAILALSTGVNDYISSIESEMMGSYPIQLQKQTFDMSGMTELQDENMSEMMERLQSLVRDDKMSNLERYKHDIIEALNSDIILRYAYRSGVVQHAAATDSSVNRAVELLLDSDEYERILREQHLERH